MYIRKADVIKLIQNCNYNLSKDEDIWEMIGDIERLPSEHLVRSCRTCKYNYIDSEDYPCSFCNADLDRYEEN